MDSANKNITYKIGFTATVGNLQAVERRVRNAYWNEAEAVEVARSLFEEGLVRVIDVVKCETVFWQVNQSALI